MSADANRNKSPRGVSDRRLSWILFLTVFSAYMLSSGRERPWGDANVQYMPAQSLLDHGDVDISRPWPDDQPPGRNGKHFSTYPVLTSIVQLPGLLILRGVTAIAPEARHFAEPLTTHLASAFFGALLALLFFRLCRERGVSQRVSSLATGILMFGTTCWVYGHYSYSEMMQAAMFVGFVRQLVQALESPDASSMRRLGVWAGLLFSSKYIYASAIAGGFLYLAWVHRHRFRELLIGVAWIASGALPFLVLNSAYNYACWEHPFRTGYHEYFASYWGENLLVGLWGMFASPGKSIFLYSPPLLLSLFAMGHLIRKQRLLAMAMLVTIAPVLLIYARYKLNGDWAWGPRFTVFAVPLLMFPIVFVLSDWLQNTSRMRRSVVATVCAFGLLIQLLGMAFYWDHYIRLSQEVHLQWLGTPNRKGAIIPIRSGGKCDSCFEDVHHLQWLPPFQPILGHWWLVRNQLSGADWKEAVTDAPWTRHTSLKLNISSTYSRVRWDWWGLLWISDHKHQRTSGILLLLLFLFGTGSGAWMWQRAHRAAKDPELPG